MKVDPKIFKAYDVRGIYPDQINKEIAYHFGKALVEYLVPNEVAVGRDVRLSSDELANELCQGIIGSGANVINLGIVSTDALYFAVGKFRYDAGVMVTASHNPPEYNGFKVCRDEAIPLSGKEGLSEIREIMVTNDYVEPESLGSFIRMDITDDYIEHVLSFVKLDNIKPFKIVIDSGNGVAGRIIPLLFKNLPCEVIPLFFEPDGNFPNHLPSPIEPENTVQLRKKVVESGAHLGVAFDGDADRVFLIDEKGQMVLGTNVTAMVAKSILAKNPGESIIYNIISSKCVPEIITGMGGEAIRTPVGHALIKPIMREENAIFGGEHSGHFYFRDNWYADSGLIALMVALELLSLEDKPLSELIRGINPYFQSGEINSRVDDREQTLNKVREYYESRGYSADTMDGITFDLGEWWFNLRPSNTEPVVRLNIEANSREILQKQQDELLKLIRGA
ncbi:phosphomannomutase/phosphoglucomutase [bacterium]|nr:phosphomannomutase/phosphoglucomutase [bacterium]